MKLYFAYSIWFNRIQEPWSDQQIDIILCEFSVAQEKLQESIKNLNGYNQIASHANPKLEPSEGNVIVGSISCNTRFETFKSSETNQYEILKGNAENNIYSYHYKRCSFS